MAKREKIIPGQLNFLATLAPHVALNPEVVLRTDPRFKSCIEELKTAPFFGLDTEYYGPWTSKKDINPYFATIRLIQVGLPSGRAIVCDFGGIADNRNLIIDQCSEFLRVLAEALYTRAQKVIGIALKGDYVALARNFGMSIRSVRDLMLISQIIWAGIGTRSQGKGKGKAKGLSHTLLAIAKRCGFNISKQEQASDWSGPLSNSQYNYAATDGLLPIKLFQILGERVKREGLINSVMAECDALPAFAECELNGMPVDLADLNKAIELWTSAYHKVIAPWKETFPGTSCDSPIKVAVALSKALDLREGDRLYTLSLPGKNGRRKIHPKVNDETLVKYDSENPLNQGETVSPRRKQICTAVHALLEGRSIATQLKYLLNIKKHFLNGYVRSKYFQIAGGIDLSGEDKAGKGMGRSSSTKPNLQNSPGLQPAHKKMGLPAARKSFKPKPGRSLIVADLSQAHARIGTQASKDKLLIESYHKGLDVHCITASRLAKQLGYNWTPLDIAQWRKDATHEHYVMCNYLRTLSKPVFYGSLNLQGKYTLKKTGETSPEPVYMTLDEAAQGITAWRELYAQLFQFQKETIKKANSYNWVFHVPTKEELKNKSIFVEDLSEFGSYAMVRGLTGRRLYLLKELDTFGRYTCKGTDAVSFIWMSTEADIIKRAMGLILEAFDANPQWDAKICNMAHDELDIECLKEHEKIVAETVQHIFDDCMRWGGLKDIPTGDLNCPLKKCGDTQKKQGLPPAALAEAAMWLNGAPQDLSITATRQAAICLACGSHKAMSMLVSSWADK